MRTRIILAIVVGAFSSCSHSQEVDREEEKEVEAKREEAKQEKETRPPAEEGRPELSTSPTASMLPQGPRLIQAALVKRGVLAAEHQTGKLDKETSAALRRFQEAEHVARTGYPDRETVRKLGLEVDEVFKATGANEESPEKRR